VMPGARAQTAYTVDDTTAEKVTACEYGSSAIPSSTVEKNLAWFDLQQTGGFTATTDCTNGFGLVVPRAGVYTVSLNFMWTANPTGYRSAGVKVVRSNTADYLGETRVPATDGTETAQNVSTTARFAVGDVIQTYVIQNSGSSVGTIADPRTSLNVQFVAP
jgi:hypothetical protein